MQNIETRKAHSRNALSGGLSINICALIQLEKSFPTSSVACSSRAFAVCTVAPPIVSVLIASSIFSPTVKKRLPAITNRHTFRPALAGHAGVSLYIERFQLRAFLHPFLDACAPRLRGVFRFIGVILRFLRVPSLTYPRFGGLSTAMKMRRTPVSLGADICRANHAGTWQNIGVPVCERSDAVCLHLALRRFACVGFILARKSSAASKTSIYLQIFFMDEKKPPDGGWVLRFNVVSLSGGWLSFACVLVFL